MHRGATVRALVSSVIVTAVIALAPRPAAAVTVFEVPDCNSATLAAALAFAAAGDIVQLGSCTVSDPVSLPAGITIDGMGPTATVLRVDPGEVGLTVLTAAGQTTTIRNLTIVSDGDAAIVATGNGTLSIANVSVEATRGIGLGADQLGELSIASSFFVGAVTPENAVDLPRNVSDDVFSSHGVVVFDTPVVSLSDVSIDAWGNYGGLFINCGLSWSGGGASSNVGAGTLVWGGSATLEALTFAGTYTGVRIHPSTGLGFTAGAHVTTVNVSATGGQGWGVFHNATGIVTHTGLVASNNGYPGVWAQSGDVIELAEASLSRNTRVGFAAIDMSFVSVTNSEIRFTEPLSGAGDGMQLIASPANVDDTQVRLNDRTAILVQTGTGETLADYSFTNVRVQGLAQSLGLIAQDDTQVLPLVTDGITRLGYARIADPDYVTGGAPLSPVDITNPCFLPDAQLVVTGGLASLL